MSALDRFVEAQAGGVFDQALAELRAGTKRGHWMWFVFPQVAGLGHSDAARFFAIADRAEAMAYLAHPVLGPRLEEACGALLAWSGKTSAVGILGSVDALKLRSSMTLFAAVADNPAPFAAVLDAFYAGLADPRTIELL